MYDRATKEHACTDHGRAGGAAPGKRTLTGQLPARVVTAASAGLGHDLSSVTVHQDGKAEALGTRAFARGDELHFAAGAYDPDSAGGQALIGHELAHVAQQREGRVAATGTRGGMAVSTDAALEAEADAAGAQVAQGFDLDGFLDFGRVSAGRVAAPVVQGESLADAAPGSSRFVDGGGGYRYEQLADGTIVILAGKGGVPLAPPRRLPPGDPNNAAITAEIEALHGPFPAAEAAPPPPPADQAASKPPPPDAPLIPPLENIVANVGGFLDGVMGAIGGLFGGDAPAADAPAPGAPAADAPAAISPEGAAPTAGELDELMALPVLSAAQIAQARAIIATLPAEEQGARFLALQDKVAYLNQRDNESDQEGETGGTCNFTAIAMALANLGIANPDPSRQFEDVLVEMAGKMNITKSETWETVVAKLGVTMELVANSDYIGPITRAQWEAIRDTHLAAGKGVVLSLRGHVIRLQGVTEDGLVVDDPYGASSLAEAKRRDRTNDAGEVTESKTKYSWETGGINSADGGEGGAKGDDQGYPWADVETYSFGAVFAFTV